MDLRSLEAFCTLARTLNFRRAADELAMSQPALSVRLARLEDELGMRLFDRSRAGVTLLETGRLFLPHARGLLDRAEATRKAAMEIAAGHSGRLRIGYTPVSFLGSVPKLLRTYANTYPDVRLELTEGLSNAIERGVGEGQLDAGFVHPPVATTGLELLPLPSQRYVLVLPSDHPLANQSRLPLSALADDEFVLVERRIGPAIYDRLIATCVQAGFAPRIRQEVVNSIAVLSLVAAGHGVGFVVGALCNLRRDDIAFVAIDGEVPVLPLALASSPNPASTVLREFSEFVGANRCEPTNGNGDGTRSS